jgi:hypothetical protein
MKRPVFLSGQKTYSSVKMSPQVSLLDRHQASGTEIPLNISYKLPINSAPCLMRLIFKFPSLMLIFKRRIKSHLPFAGTIRSSPYSPRFQDNG